MPTIHDYVDQGLDAVTRRSSSHVVGAVPSTEDTIVFVAGVAAVVAGSAIVTSLVLERRHARKVVDAFNRGRAAGWTEGRLSSRSSPLDRPAPPLYSGPPPSGWCEFGEDVT